MRSLLKPNEHPVERAARVVLGLTLLAMTTRGVIGAWGYIGIVPLITGLSGICPLYSLLGISTCPSKAGR
ncbi:MAG: DUF2892 domain-containing protein [Acidimicrobiia bacterium]